MLRRPAPWQSVSTQNRNIRAKSPRWKILF